MILIQVAFVVSSRKPLIYSKQLYPVTRSQLRFKRSKHQFKKSTREVKDMTTNPVLKDRAAVLGVLVGMALEKISFILTMLMLLH